ncbi:MAG: hypothetical protein WD767_02505 [Alphaproteobacteria bacterium]
MGQPAGHPADKGAGEVDQPGRDRAGAQYLAGQDEQRNGEYDKRNQPVRHLAVEVDQVVVANDIGQKAYHTERQRDRQGQYDEKDDQQDKKAGHFRSLCKFF